MNRPTYRQALEWLMLHYPTTSKPVGTACINLVADLYGITPVVVIRDFLDELAKQKEDVVLS